MNDIREILEGQDNEASQGATNVHEDKGKPPLPPKAGNASKKRSFGWSHFTIIERGGGGGGEPRVACNYCGTTYVCDSKLDGIIAMKTHIQS